MPEILSPSENESANKIPEEALCPHGRVAGLCTECNKNELESNETESTDLEKELGVKPYDVVMILGAGYKKRTKTIDEIQEKGGGGWMLNNESRMRLTAGAQLYFEGRAKKVLVTGGPAITEKWQDYGSLAELGIRFLTDKLRVPKEDIIFEDQSDATHGNYAYGLRALAESGMPINSMAVISTNYHLNRARRFAQEFGIEADVIPAESKLLDRDIRYAKYVARWLEHAQSAGLEAAEIVKLGDDKYWSERAAIFRSKMDESVPPLDISEWVKKTAEAKEQVTGEKPEDIF